MGVKIKLVGTLQSLAGDREVIEVKGDTIGQCLDAFIAEFPVASKFLFDNNNALSALVIINDESIPTQDINRPVSDGDVLLLVQLVAGG